MYSTTKKIRDKVGTISSVGFHAEMPALYSVTQNKSGENIREIEVKESITKRTENRSLPTLVLLHWLLPRSRDESGQLSNRQ